MEIAALIAEFNPFHNGHKYLIEEIKKQTNCDYIICIMSGNFTQAGNIALTNKFKRAKTAISNGIDLVIELPTVFATSSSEYFAKSAIKILDNLNVIDYLCFGSETSDVNVLKNIAQKLIQNEEIMWQNISKFLKTGISFAHAREKAISCFLTNEEIQAASLANNILAIEYIKEIIKSNSKMQPIAIKRDFQYKSATSIRDILSKDNNIQLIQNYIPYDCTLLSNYILNEKLYNYLKYIIVLNGKNKEINGITEGLENKIYAEINNSNNYDEFIQNIKSKRYELSKIKRILISILLNITQTDFNACSDALYAHVLAISNTNKDIILSSLAKSSNIPILTNISDKLLAKLDDNIKKSLYIDLKASNIYSVIQNDKINNDYTNLI